MKSFRSRLSVFALLLAHAEDHLHQIGAAIEPNSARRWMARTSENPSADVR